MTTNDPPRAPGAHELPVDLFAEVLDLSDEVVGRVTDDEVEAGLRRIQKARRGARAVGDAATGTSAARSPAAEDLRPATLHLKASPALPRRWPAATLLGRLPERTRRELVAIGAFREYASGEVLMAEGDTSTFVVLLLNGWVKVTAATQNGGFALLAIGHGGDLVGEQAGLDGQPRSATVTAAGGVLAKVVPLETFLGFLQSHPDVGAAALRSVSAKLRSATRRRIEFGGCTVATRLARVVCELERSYGTDATDGPGRRVQIALTQPELAALVGAAEPTVHKVLRKLRQQDIVDTRYRAIVIRDIEALYRIARVERPNRESGRPPGSSDDISFSADGRLMLFAASASFHRTL